MRNVVVRRLDSGDVASVAALSARAFADNNLYRWMLPRGDTGAELCSFFARNLEWHRSGGLTWVAEVDGVVAGTFTWERPGGVPAGRAAALRHWLVPTWRSQGPRGVVRLARADAAFRQRQTELCGGSTYWHLHAVAVEPALQGAGVGTQMMRSALAALHELQSEQPSPVMLATQKEANLTFYERFGFAVSDQRRMLYSARDPGFESWFMTLEPRSRA